MARPRGAGGYEALKHRAFSRLRRLPNGEELCRAWRLPVMVGAAFGAEAVASALLCPLEVRAAPCSPCLARTGRGGQRRGRHGALVCARAPPALPLLSRPPSAACPPNALPLSPLQVLKLRIQTDPTYAARGLLGALSLQVRREGTLSLFTGLSAICLRQLPYTAVKLVAYELFASLLLSAALRTGMLAGTAPSDERPRGCGRSLPASSSGGSGDGSAAPAVPRPLISLGAGMLAGAAAALASQPADVLLTRLCGSSSVSQLSSCVIASGWLEQLKYLCSIGLKECYAGLGPRLAMVASMTSVQFLLYDQVRLVLGCAGPVPPDRSDGE